MHVSQAKLQPIVLYLLTGLYLLTIIGPTFALLTDLDTVSLSERPSLILPNERQQQVFVRSFGLAAAVALGGMGLGLLAAISLQRWQHGLMGQLRWLLVVLAPLPPVIHAMAWSWAAGILNRGLTRGGLRQIPFQGWMVAWWVQIVWLAPIAIGLALIAIGSVSARVKEAARLLQPDLRTLTRIVLPLACPLLLAGCGILFLLSLVDYTIPSLCQISVTSMDVFADFSIHNQPGRALMVSAPLLATTFSVLTFSQAKLRPAALTPPRRHTVAPAPDWPPGFRTLLNGALVLMLLAVCVPLASLLAQVRDMADLVGTLTEARSEITTSLSIAFLTALLSLPLATVAARGALSDGGIGKVWWAGITLPLALPGPLVGIGLIKLWNAPELAGLGVYGSSWMPVLAALARYTPIGALVLIAAMRRINPLLIDAAQLLETHRIRTWLWVHLPLLAPGMLAAAGVVFSLTLGELSATLLVSPPGQSTLTMRIYNYLHYGASETVAGLTLVLVSLILAFALVVAAFLTLWRRLTQVAQVPVPSPDIGQTGEQMLPSDQSTPDAVAPTNSEGHEP